MRNSNRHVKAKVQAGTLCYVCEHATPTLLDNAGGRICQPCFTHMCTAYLAAILKSGYQIRTKGSTQ